MTWEQFMEYCAKRAGTSVGMMKLNGMRVDGCDCGGEHCPGWKLMDKGIEVMHWGEKPGKDEDS